MQNVTVGDGGRPVGCLRLVEVPAGPALRFGEQILCTCHPSGCREENQGWVRCALRLRTRVTALRTAASAVRGGGRKGDGCLGARCVPDGSGRGRRGGSQQLEVVAVCRRAAAVAGGTFGLLIAQSGCVGARIQGKQVPCT